MTSKKIITDLISDFDSELKDSYIINDSKCYDDVFREGSLGLAESYIKNKWDMSSTSSVTLDQLFDKIGRYDLITKLTKQSWYIKIYLFITYIYNMISWQTIKSSKVVADNHYNLDTRLYNKMLSSDMMYSCAYFSKPDMTLNEAQLEKLDLIANKLKFKPGMRVLDIGCGWGYACHYFTTKYKVEVVGITISNEQYKYACKHYPNVLYHLNDYRCLPNLEKEGSFEAIYSIGMFEHVTSKHYSEFMEICNKMLKPNGLFLLHTIGGNTSNIVNDRFLEKYIFPNSMLPSLADIAKSSEKLFIIEDVQNFGCHYDKTLMCWYNNFINNLSELTFLSNEFKRMWSYYLLSCAGTFRSKGCQLYQVVLSKERYEHYERVV